jgi:hypothetical protein
MTPSFIDVFVRFFYAAQTAAEEESFSQRPKQQSAKKSFLKDI